MSTNPKSPAARVAASRARRWLRGDRDCLQCWGAKKVTDGAGVVHDPCPGCGGSGQMAKPPELDLIRYASQVRPATTTPPEQGDRRV